jgi:myo-inositol 2-dehydrogenase/D-chiro-inositol 1-dehydrogenase
LSHVRHISRLAIYDCVVPTVEDQILKYAIIGSGMMGLEHIRNLCEIPNTQIVAVCDPHTPSLEKARRALNRVEGVRYFANFKDLLANCIADVVVIATPNHTHADIASEVLRTGKHLLIEKPLCTTVSDCKKLISLQTEVGFEKQVVWVGLEYRYMAPTARVLQEVDKGTVGKVKMVSIREHRYPFLEKVDDWNRFNVNTGGTLVEKCCHFFDLMCLIAKSRPISVMASGSQDVNHLNEKYDGKVPDILDNAFVIVNFENGVRGLLDLCMFAEASKNEQEISVVGDKGKIEAMISESIVRIGKRKDGYGSFQEIPITIDQNVVKGFHHGASYVEHMQLQNAVRNDRSAEVGLQEGLWSVAIGQAAHLSIEEGRLVLLSEVMS